MTSFGDQIVSEGNFMPTFKVQGQVYHLLGSLLPSLSQDHVQLVKFLQIYFMGDEKSETDKRCQIIPDVKPTRSLGRRPWRGTVFEPSL